MAEIQSALGAAKQPLMIVGGPGWSGETRERVQDFARRFDMPVVSSFRCQDYFDNRLETYVGHAGVGMDPTLAKAINDADVLFVVGSRLGRNDDQRLHADRHPEPQAEADPCPPERR